MRLKPSYKYKFWILSWISWILVSGRWNWKWKYQVSAACLDIETLNHVSWWKTGCHSWIQDLCHSSAIFEVTPSNRSYNIWDIGWPTAASGGKRKITAETTVVSEPSHGINGQYVSGLDKLMPHITTARHCQKITTARHCKTLPKIAIHYQIIGS